MKFSTAPLLVISALALVARAQQNETAPTPTSAPSVPSPSTSPADPNGVCSTRECVLSAAAVLKNMNPEADPCVDFYQFACGGFDATQDIPDDASSISMFGLARDRTNKLVRKLLEADPATIQGPNGTELDAASRALLDQSQSLYKSCMNETELAAVGRQPLWNDLQQLTTTVFPVSGSQLAPAFGTDNSTMTMSMDPTALSKALAKFVRSGVDSILNINVYIDPLHTATQGVYLGEGGLSLPSKEYYTDNGVASMLQRVVEEMFSLVLGPQMANNSTASAIDAKQIAADVVAFETKLANISTNVQDLYDSTKSVNPLTVQQLGQLNSAIDWPLFVEESLQSNTSNYRNLTVSSPAYITKLTGLLNTTQPTTLQNFYAWKTIQGAAGRLSKEYRRPLERFSATLSGSDPDIPPTRWQACVRVTNRDLGSMVGHFYIADEFPPEAKQLGEDIIVALKDSFGAGFPNLTWLDNQTRQGAETKLAAMEPQIGYSSFNPDVASAASVQEYYTGLALTPGDFYGNQGRAQRWRIEHQLSQAGKETDKRKMDADPQVVNAFFSPLTNQIIFPAGILQPPFFLGANPEYLNFGAYGVVAGHEVTHGFDNNGRQYDANGTFTDWWTNATSAQFEAKSQCFIDQYSNFTIPNPEAGGAPLHVNGHLTLGENLADNGGLKRSFEAWQARYASDPQSTRYDNRQLAGLNAYTREQLFFVAYGQVWCNKQRPKALLQQVRTDPHSPARARVNVPVQNSVAFSQAFKCGPSAPMNPPKKCEMW